MTEDLRRVLVRPPSAASFRAWREYGWHAKPDLRKLAEEHEAFCDALRAAGAEVVLAANDVVPVEEVPLDERLLEMAKFGS